jgi:hypothetical protein
LLKTQKITPQVTSAINPFNAFSSAPDFSCRWVLDRSRCTLSHSNRTGIHTSR